VLLTKPLRGADVGMGDYGESWDMASLDNEHIPTRKRIQWMAEMECLMDIGFFVQLDLRMRKLV